MKREEKMTPDDWMQARIRWEATDATQSDIAKEFGVSKVAVWKRAKKEGWVKAGSLVSINRAAHIRADAKSAKEISAQQPKAQGSEDAQQEHSRGESVDAGTVNAPITEPVNELTDGPALPSMALSTELREGIIHAHRSEWRTWSATFRIGDMAKSDALARRGEIVSRALATKQRAERAAWGMDEDGGAPEIIVQRGYGNAA